MADRPDVGDEVVLDLDLDDDPHLEEFDGERGTVDERLGPASFYVEVPEKSDRVLVADHEVRPVGEVDDG